VVVEGRTDMSDIADKDIERIARIIAFYEGARMAGPGQSEATREFGWKGDGEHFEKYTDNHWAEYKPAAESILAIMPDIHRPLARAS